MERKRSGVWGVLLLLLLTGCGRVTEPGQKGKPPEAPTARAVWSSGLIASPLACGKPYHLNVYVSQKTMQCDSFDHAALYRRAKGLIEARAAQLACPGLGDCSHKNLYYTKWKMDCGGTPGAHRMGGWVLVKAIVICGEAIDAGGPVSIEPPQDLSHKADLAVPGEMSGFGSEFQAGMTPEWDTGEWFQDVGEDAAETDVLEGPKLFALNCREKIPGGGEPSTLPHFTYNAYIERAKERARVLYGLYSCQAPLQKGRFKPEYVGWGYDPDWRVVSVLVCFKVDCKGK